MLLEAEAYVEDAAPLDEEADDCKGAAEEEEEKEEKDTALSDIIDSAMAEDKEEEPEEEEHEEEEETAGLDTVFDSFSRIVKCSTDCFFRRRSLFFRNQSSTCCFGSRV